MKLQGRQELEGKTGKESREMEERKKVFICSPFRGDMEGNARKAAVYSRMACDRGYLPIAPHLLFPQFLNEGIEAERQLGISMGMELLLDRFRRRRQPQGIPAADGRNQKRAYPCGSDQGCGDDCP